jgi:hypothetical protein
MDWLEDFFPFLRELDAGNGALEVALVLLVIVVLAVTAMATMQRMRSRTSERASIDDREPDPDGRHDRAA